MRKTFTPARDESSEPYVRCRFRLTVPAKELSIHCSGEMARFSDPQSMLRANAANYAYRICVVEDSASFLRLLEEMLAAIPGSVRCPFE